MLTRRDFLKAAALASLAPAGCVSPGTRPRRPRRTQVNDVHSQLNPTRVWRIVQPDSLDGVRSAIRGAARKGRARSRSPAAATPWAASSSAPATAAARHAAHERDPRLRRGAAAIIEVEAGIQWPRADLRLPATRSKGRARAVGRSRRSRPAPTGSRIGGALAANVHGRGLTMPPFIGDVESFGLVDAEGELRRCSRTENAELFRARDRRLRPVRPDRHGDACGWSRGASSSAWSR